MKYVSARHEGGKLLDPPISGNRLVQLCRERRVRGARKFGNAWHVPASLSNRDIRGVGRRSERSARSKPDTISAYEYAKKYGRSKMRAYQLLNDDRVEGAIRTHNGWEIPKDAPWPEDKTKK